MARPEVRSLVSLGTLFRSRHCRVMVHLLGRCRLDFTQKTFAIRWIQRVVLGLERLAQSGKLQSRTMGRCNAGCRYQIHDIHHQTSRRILYLRLQIHGLLHCPRSLQGQSAQECSLPCIRCFPQKRFHDGMLFLQTRLAQRKLLGSVLCNSHAKSQL